MDDIFEIIDSYKDSDIDYYNDLFSMIQMLDYDDFAAFGELLKDAESKSKKITVKIDNKQEWDSLLLKNIVIK